ncbi:MAG: glycosyltransferase, partial [Planctomycetota bacterium]
MSLIRVVHVITRMVRGGAQQVVLDLARHTDRSKFRTEVICGEREPTLLGALRKLAPVRTVPGLVREVSPRSDVRALVSLFRAFRDRPHVVHGHTYKAGVLACIAARRAGVRAVIFTPHGHIFERDANIPGVPSGPKLHLLKMLTRYAQSCAHVITALSEEDLE